MKFPKINRLFFNVLILVIFHFISPPLYALDVKSIFEKTRPSVVLIVSYDANEQPKGIGSGFFFGDDTTIATNLHVIQNSTKLVIKFSDGRIDQIDTILGVDAERDLAIMKSTQIGTPLVLAKRVPDIGEDVIAIGNPKGLEGTVSSGIVSGIRTDDKSQYFQITAPISPGSSGGPVIDEFGEVLGVSTSYIDGSQSLNFAMPVAYLTKLYSTKSDNKLQILKAEKEPNLSRIKENVEIVAPQVDFTGRIFENHVSASIFNRSRYSITNVRFLIQYYVPGEKRPLHFSLHEFKDIIPPNLSYRYVKKYVKNVQGKWSARGTILDYDIIQSENGTQLLTFE